MQFLLRYPCSGRLPIEKMDLMNTINQLLRDLSKTKGEKDALKEELKAQRLSHLRDRASTTVTPRDLALVVANKVYTSSFTSTNPTKQMQ